MFDDPRSYLWLIPALPLLASVLIALFGYRILRGQSHWVCITGAVGACTLSVCTLVAVSRGFEDYRVYYTFFAAGNVQVNFSLQADALTAVMLVTVTFMGSSSRFTPPVTCAAIRDIPATSPRSVCFCSR